jgi:cytochrome oxidase assembly protein ShyY1
MYRFMLRPRWILSHVLVLALIISMINLSMWQVRRLDQKKATNRQIVHNTKVPPLDLAAAVAAVGKGGADGMKFRRVSATGTYEAGKEVAIRGHTLDGAPGRWVAGFFGSTDAPTGTLHELSRVDVKRFAQQFHAPIAPFWIQLQRQTPATSSKQAGLLSAVPLPALDEGPHFSYAVQWAIFTAIAIIGYPLILRRVAQQEARERASEEREGGGGRDGDDDDGVPPSDGDDPARDRPQRREAEVG